MGVLQLQRGDAEAGEQWLRHARQQQPSDPDTLFSLGRACQLLGRHEEAEHLMRQARALAKSSPEFAEGLANLLQARGRYEDALALYREAVALEPRRTSAKSNLGVLLMKLGHTEAAYPLLREVADRRPDPTVLTNLALAERANGRYEAAIALLDRALAAAPGNLDAIAGKAQVLERMGRAEAACALLEPLIAVGRGNLRLALAFAGVAQRVGRTTEARDALISALRGSTDVHEAQQAYFALARLEEALGNFDAAFQIAGRGNQLAPKVYDPAAVAERFAKLTAFFSHAHLAALPRAGNTDARPIFIIGMPRSGTTLVEQILASHPAVAGGGERPDIARLVEEVVAEADDVLPYPDCLAGMSPNRIGLLADRYLDRVSLLGGGARRVTDKMPGNFEHIGFIAMLLPGARILHCVRDPLDTCVSCFLQNFRSGNDFASNLAHLGRHYRQYAELMEHWHVVRPLPILDVVYEELVHAPASTVRTILEFCGLDWNEACLAFHENKRRVLTASHDQVRQPLYTTSIGRHRRFAAHLAPLHNALRRRMSLVGDRRT